MRGAHLILTLVLPLVSVAQLAFAEVLPNRKYSDAEIEGSKKVFALLNGDKWDELYQLLKAEPSLLRVPVNFNSHLASPMNHMAIYCPSADIITKTAQLDPEMLKYGGVMAIDAVTVPTETFVDPPSTNHDFLAVRQTGIALTSAIENKNVDFKTFEKLVELNPASTLEPSSSNLTAIHYALHHQKYEFFRLLLHKDVEELKRRKTSLFGAATVDDVRFFDQVAKEAPELLLGTKSGIGNVLHLAAQNSNAEVLEHAIRMVPPSYGLQDSERGFPVIQAVAGGGDALKHVLMLMKAYPKAISMKSKAYGDVKSALVLFLSERILEAESMLKKFPELMSPLTQSIVEEAREKAFARMLFHSNPSEFSFYRNIEKLLTHGAEMDPVVLDVMASQYLDGDFIKTLASIRRDTKALNSTEWNHRTQVALLDSYLKSAGDIKMLQNILKNRFESKNRFDSANPSGDPAIHEQRAQEYFKDYNSFLAKLLAAHYDRAFKNGSAMHLIYDQIEKAKVRARHQGPDGSWAAKLGTLEDLRDKMRAEPEFKSIAERLDSELAKGDVGVSAIARGAATYLTEFNGEGARGASHD